MSECERNVCACAGVSMHVWIIASGAFFPAGSLILVQWMLRCGAPAGGVVSSCVRIGFFFFVKVGDEKRGCDNNGASILGAFSSLISCQ